MEWKCGRVDCGYRDMPLLTVRQDIHSKVITTWKLACPQNVVQLAAHVSSKVSGILVGNGRRHDVGVAANLGRTIYIAGSVS